MQLKHLTSLALAGLVSGASLTEVISQTPDLSTLGTILEQYPAVASVLANATNITVLAPSNAALAAFLTPAVTAAVQADPGLVTAVLLYHVLSGTIASTDITATPTFAKTLLTNATYTNVTGGQVIKAQSDDDGGVVFTSGLLQESHVTTADVEFDGGLVHIIDSVLTIPQSDSATALAANLTALAGALTQADLVSTVDGLEVGALIYPLSSSALCGLGYIPKKQAKTFAELTRNCELGCNHLRPDERCLRRHCEPGRRVVLGAAFEYPHLPRRPGHRGL